MQVDEIRWIINRVIFNWISVISWKWIKFERTFTFSCTLILLFRAQWDDAESGQQNHGDGRSEGEEGKKSGGHGSDVALDPERPAELSRGGCGPVGIEGHFTARLMFSAHTRHVIHRSRSHWRVAGDGRGVISPTVVLLMATSQNDSSLAMADRQRKIFLSKKPKWRIKSNLHNRSAAKFNQLNISIEFSSCWRATEPSVTSCDRWNCQDFGCRSGTRTGDTFLPQSKRWRAAVSYRLRSPTLFGLGSIRLVWSPPPPTFTLSRWANVRFPLILECFARLRSLYHY